MLLSDLIKNCKANIEGQNYQQALLNLDALSRGISILEAGIKGSANNLITMTEQMK